MKYDIQTVGNNIGGRQGWAYVCNSGEVTVLKADLDKKQEYEEYKTFGKARVTWNYRGHETFSTCELAYNACHGEPYWELTSWGCCLSASFGLHDALELIDDSQAPVVRKGEVIAIASYSTKSAMLRLYKIEHVDIHCQCVAKLIPLSDEEMEEVKKNINKWLNR